MAKEQFSFVKTEVPFYHFVFSPYEKKSRVLSEDIYRKIPGIRPPFDAQNWCQKGGGGLIREDLTFDTIDQWNQVMSQE